MRRSIAVFLFAAFAALPAARLTAAVIPPIGLAPGSSYQLIFVTAGVRDAVDTDIGVYNTFVTDEAALGVPFGLPSEAIWNAVASTDTIDANVNAPSVALPVYNTAGQQVTGPGVGIYTGVLDNLVAYDQFGNFAVDADASNVWTGSDDQGFGIPDATLAAGSGFTEVGQLALDATWLELAAAPQFGEVIIVKPLYALSEALTVPVPEPGAITLVGTALLLIGGHGLLQRRKRADEFAEGIA